MIFLINLFILSFYFRWFYNEKNLIKNDKSSILTSKKLDINKFDNFIIDDELPEL
jgi:hypothetical protein